MSAPHSQPPDSPEIVGRLVRHARRGDRWCLVHPDGTPSNSFGRSDTREVVETILAEHGMVLLEDNTVRKAA